MERINITLSFDVSVGDEVDADDVAQEIADMAARRFPAVVKRVEHIDRDMPRTYGDLYRADGYDPDKCDDHDADDCSADRCPHCGGCPVDHSEDDDE